MAFKTFNFHKYNLILILIAFIGIDNLASQDILSFQQNDINEDYFELYQSISELNNRSGNTYTSFNDYKYVLDSFKLVRSPLDQLSNDFQRTSGTFRYRLDSLCVISESYTYTGSASDGSLRPWLVFTSKFNSNNQEVKLQTDSWDGEEYVHNFELPFEDQYLYENNLLISKRSPNVLDTLIYDDNGLLIKMYKLTPFENPDSLSILRKHFYNHNEKGFLESIVNISFSRSFDEFRVVDSIYYNYDDIGNLIKEERYTPNYDSILVDYNLQHRFSYSYEAETLINREKRFSPIVDQDTLWLVEERTEYFYNPDGSLDSYNIWDIKGGSNSLIMYKEYDYDTSISTEDILLSISEDKYAVIRIRARINNYGYSSSSIAGISGDIEPGTTFLIYKPRETVSTSETSQRLQVKLSPNPVSDILIIQLDNRSEEYHLSIYDSAGRPHLNKISRDMKIDLSNLPSGTQKVGSGTFVKM